jgi:hypothetical protein
MLPVWYHAQLPLGARSTLPMWALSTPGYSGDCGLREVMETNRGPDVSRYTYQVTWSAEEGEAVPEPISERSYSGKFNLRIEEGLHRRLAIQAAEEHVSLNQHTVRRLSEAS